MKSVILVAKPALNLKIARNALLALIMRILQVRLAFARFHALRELMPRNKTKILNNSNAMIVTKDVNLKKKNNY